MSEFTIEGLQAGSTEYSDEQRALLEWLLIEYYPQTCAGSRIALCAELRCEWTLVTRIASGVYPASPDSFFRRAARLRRQWELLPGGGYIETCVTTEIAKVLDFTLQRLCLTLVEGETGRSKTLASTRWVNQHADQAFYVECPSTGGLPELQLKIFEAMGKGSDYTHNCPANARTLRKRLAGCVLVLDEVARLIRKRSVTQIDFLREMHDLADVGMCFVATHDFVSGVVAGPMWKHLEQFVGRLGDKLLIPPKVSWQEAAEIAAALNAKDEGLVSEVHRIGNETGHMRTVLKQVMPDALLLAQSEGRRVTAADVRVVWADYEGTKRLPEE